jgi:hypothetical protein
VPSNDNCSACTGSRPAEAQRTEIHFQPESAKTSNDEPEGTVGHQSSPAWAESPTLLAIAKDRIVARRTPVWPHDGLGHNTLSARSTIKADPYGMRWRTSWLE